MKRKQKTGTKEISLISYLVLCIVTNVLIEQNSLFCSEIVKIPVIYNEGYDFKFSDDLKKAHPLDGEKYSKIINSLKDEINTLSDNNFIDPEEEITTKELLTVHSEDYLVNSLKNKSTIASIACVKELEDCDIDFLEEKLLKPMRWATKGTIVAAEMAVRYGWAINVGGGYHHAKKTTGEGFCFYRDIPLACLKILQQDSTTKILIVDLDAHQGNGNALFLEENSTLQDNIAIFDIYNDTIYPSDQEKRAKHIKFNYPASKNFEADKGRWKDDSAYYGILQNELKEAICDFQPTHIIYNAGSDIYELDILGGFGISQDGIITRDEWVFWYARKYNIPITMVLSGGYHEDSYKIVGNSILNLHEKGLICLDPQKIEEYTQTRMDKKNNNNQFNIPPPPIPKKKENNNNGKSSGFSGIQKTFIGAAGGIFACIVIYCLVYKINPMTALKKLFNKQTT